MSISSIYHNRGPGRFFREMRNGLRNQANVVFALIFKDFKRRTGRYARLGLMWIVLDPITHVVVMSMMWWLLGRTSIDGVPIILFIAVATAPYSIITKGLTTLPRAVVQNRAFYAYQQVKPFDAVVSEWVLETSLIIIGEILLFAGLWWFFDLTINYYLMMPLIALILLSMVLSFGLALAAAAYSALFDSFPRILGLMARPLVFISGLFYSTTAMPEAARVFLSWNPILQINEHARHYALGLRLFPEASISYTLMFTISALFFGFLSYAAFRDRMLEQ